MPRPVYRLRQLAQIEPEADRRARFVASTADPDRMGRSVAVDGWDLAAFRRNPVLLWAHDTTIPPIGRVNRIGPEARALVAEVEFLPEGADPFADKIAALVAGGWLSAVSVAWQPIDEPEPRTNKAGELVGWHYPRNELLELSVVPVPANPRALAAALDLSCNERDLDRLFEGDRVQAAPRLARHRIALALARVGAKPSARRGTQ